MKNEIVFDESSSFSAYHKTSETIFSEVKTPNASKPIIKDSSSLEYAIWGEDNLRPQKLIQYIEANDLIPTIIDFKVRSFYGDGLVYGYDEVDETTGADKFKRLVVPEIDEWLEKIAIHRYLLKVADDYYSLKNAFVELSVSVGGRVENITCKDASMCRLSKQDNAGKINTVYVNANWDNGGTAENSIKVQAIDPDYDVAGQIKPGKNHIIPLRKQRRGRFYYDKAEWEALIEAGWIDLATLIPQYKKKLMENQLSIKYHVQIPDYWWKWKFKNWDSMDAKQQAEKKQAEVTNFVEFMKGTKNAGNVFFTTFKYDERINKEFPGWKINILEMPKGGEYIEDSQETDFHIIRAFGVDPTIVGIGPGKGHQSGSGSDKRVASNHYNQLTAADHDIMISPIDIAAKINGFNSYVPEGKKLYFMTKSFFIATLDQVTEEKRN